MANRELGGCGVWVFGLAFMAAGALALTTKVILPLLRVHAAASWHETTCAIFDVDIARDADGDL